MSSASPTALPRCLPWVFGSPAPSHGSASSANETDGTLDVSVQLSMPVRHKVIVPILLGGNALRPDDYTCADSVTIPRGQLSADLTLYLNDDLTDEHDETVEIMLGKPWNAELGTILLHSATILDDDDPPSVEFSASTQDGSEGAGSIGIGVELSALSGKDVTVTFSATGGTAVDPDDYTLGTSPVIIPAGQLSADLSVLPVDDGDDELDETVELTLGTPTDATLGALVDHTLTIFDDDGPAVDFTTSSQTLGESSPTATVTVVRDIANSKDTRTGNAAFIVDSCGQRASVPQRRCVNPRCRMMWAGGDRLPNRPLSCDEDRRRRAR